jgi:hypothetical protein
LPEGTSENFEEISVRITRFLVEIVNRDLLNTKQICYTFYRNVRGDVRVFFLKIYPLSLGIKYCCVAPRGRSIERPLLINGYAYLAVSLLDNGQVDSNS